MSESVPAVVVLRSPLSDRAGASEVKVRGVTVGDALASLERGHPNLHGWVLDEQGKLRTHVKTFVNGEQAGSDTGLSPGDRIQVLHAISGG